MASETSFWIDIILCTVWAFSLVVFAIPSIINVSHAKKLLDLPNERTVHLDGTPRLGGLAIFAGFISAITIFSTVTPEIQRLMASCLLLFFIGIKDDVIGVSAFKKFFIQCLAAGIMVFLADVRITSFYGFLGLFTLEDNISYGFSIMVVLMITNSINLLDGLDGLAGSISSLILLVFGVAFVARGGVDYIAYGLVAISLAASCLGFLKFNFLKAKIFMGDTGSLLLGFVISILAIKFIEMGAMRSGPAFCLAVLVIPIFDTLRVFALRIFRGVSPFMPDKNHLHHNLLRFGFSQVQAVLLLLVFNILMMVLFYFLQPLGNTILVLLYAFLLGITTLVFSLMKSKSSKGLYGAH